MENEYSSVMANHSDDELLIIVKEKRNGYQAEAISAAELELEKRGLLNDELRLTINEPIPKNEILDNEIIYASFEKRFFARLIDVAIILSVFYLAVYVYNLNETSSSQIQEKEKSGFPFLIFYLLYYPLLEASGGTYGKRIMKIRPVSEDTLENISLGQAYKRSFFLIWPFALPIIVSIIGFIFDFAPTRTLNFITILVILFGIIAPSASIWSKTKQGWHDSWAKIIIVQKNKKRD